MALSPMMKQYMATKEQYADCILMYRVGDFYEMFFDDAVTASKILGLTLTGKDCGLSERAPMCGVPHHAVTTYINGLVEAGQKVAVCDQLTEPIKGELVQRGVTRVVTAGTKTDNDMLDEKSNNFIACVSKEGNYFGIAWADITTGELFCTSTSKDDVKELAEVLMKIAPAEIVSTSELSKQRIIEVERKVLPKFIPYHDWAFEYKTAVKKIKKQLSTVSLEPYGIDKNRPCITAVGALFEYLTDTQKRQLDNLSSIRFVKKNSSLIFDSNTRRNLELLYSNRDGKRFGTLYGLLNKTQTPMGARLLQRYIEEPLIDEKEINLRLGAVEELVNNTYVRDDLYATLGEIRDIARLSGKLSYGNATPIDLLAIKRSLSVLPKLKNTLSRLSSEKISKLNDDIDELDDLCAYLNAAISEDATSQTKDGGYIKHGFSEELDSLKDLSENGKRLISDLEEKEREKTGIKTLKIAYNRVFGYYIEVTRSFQNLVPLNYIRKQTVANAERYITDELKELENSILNSTENAIKLEYELLNRAINVAKGKLTELLKTSEAIANLDVLTSFAIVSNKYSYVKPEISESNTEISITGGRHLIVERLNSEEQFVANDTYLNSDDSRTMILTGPNMAGKSTYMRQVAIIAIMAQMGCFVPATSASLPIFDKVFTRVGASDNLIFDQSTFMVEMIEVSNILHNATPKSLIILDEVGRGTSTLDGMAIAFAVTKYINNEIKAKTLFATHYHELTELEGTLYGVKNYHISVKELNGTIIFLRKIVRGGANRSFGIEVASLAGLPKSVIKDAKQTLKHLEDSDFIQSKKQLTLDDVSAENRVDVNGIVEKLNTIDVDEITPRAALDILEDLKDMIK